MIKGQHIGETNCIFQKCANDECDKIVKIKPSVFKNNNYKLFCCSVKCRSHPSYREKFQLVFKERNGYSNVYQRDDVKEKIKQTNLKNLGVDNPSKSKEVINKIKTTTFERYGVSSYMKLDGVGRNMYEKRLDSKIDLSGAVPRKQSEETCIKKYGTKTFFASKEGNMSFKNLKKRGWTDDELKALSKSKGTTKENFIERYGQEIGSEKWELYLKNKSYEGSIQRYKDLYGEEQGPIIYWKNKKKFHRSGIASAESLKYFIPLYKKLRKSGILRDDIYLGINGSKEWFLSDRETKSFFLYDFTIRSLKIIIEYNGFIFHPNPEKLTTQEWEKWTTPFSTCKKTADQKYELDCLKLEVAKSKGFKVLEIWSNDDFENNWQKIKSIFNGRI